MFVPFSEKSNSQDLGRFSVKTKQTQEMEEAEAGAGGLKVFSRLFTGAGKYARLLLYH